ncbi:MAG: hypothetical protein QM773_02865 [Hyphomonadaceae bacterium]
MISVRLTGLGMVVALCAAGPAQPQSPFPSNYKTYDRAMEDVTSQGCERNDAETYIRFYCSDDRTIWFFTQPGRPEYPGYAIKLAYLPKTSQTLGTARSNSADVVAFRTWLSALDLSWWDVYGPTQNSGRELKPRDSGKLYPAQP